MNKKEKILKAYIDNCKFFKLRLKDGTLYNNVVCISDGLHGDLNIYYLWNIDFGRLEYLVLSIPIKPKNIKALELQEAFI